MKAVIASSVARDRESLHAQDVVRVESLGG